MSSSGQKLGSQIGFRFYAIFYLTFLYGPILFLPKIGRAHV